MTTNYAISHNIADDPQPGDVAVPRDGWSRTVTARFFDGSGEPYVVYSQYHTIPLKKWRRWSRKSGTVVGTYDDPRLMAKAAKGARPTMPIDPETQAYLDGEWEAVPVNPVSAERIQIPFRGVTIFGPDGDPILQCNCHNAAHFLTPEDVAEYLLELKADRKRLAYAAKRYERSLDEWRASIDALMAREAQGK